MRGNKAVGRSWKVRGVRVQGVVCLWGEELRPEADPRSGRVGSEILCSWWRGKSAAGR